MRGLWRYLICFLHKTGIVVFKVMLKHMSLLVFILNKIFNVTERILFLIFSCFKYFHQEIKVIIIKIEYRKFIFS